MAIEIKRLVVKSNVIQRFGPENRDASSSEESKREILEEMKTMISETLRKQKER